MALYLYQLRLYGVQASVVLVVSLCYLKSHAGSILIQSNDSLAKVMVDGVTAGVVPQKIDCKNNETKLSVLSKNGQVFSRILPSQSQFVPSLHSDWNVIFSNKNNQNILSESVVVNDSNVGRNTVEIFDNHKRIFQELDQLKLEIQRLQGQGVVKTNTVRAMSSVTGSSKDQLQGFYLQLHAFKEAQWDFNSISEEVSVVDQAHSQYRIQFCLKDKSLGEKWTKVYWGPFNSEALAKDASIKIKRQTVLVKNPVCKIF